MRKRKEKASQSSYDKEYLERLQAAETSIREATAELKRLRAGLDRAVRALSHLSSVSSRAR